MAMEVSRNRDKNRFETKVGNDCAFIDYTLKDDTLYLTHTEVPPAMQGKGIGSKLVAATLNYIEEAGFKIVSTCPFVSNYLKKHPEYAHLVAV